MCHCVFFISAIVVVVARESATYMKCYHHPLLHETQPQDSGAHSNSGRNETNQVIPVNQVGPVSHTARSCRQERTRCRSRHHPAGRRKRHNAQPRGIRRPSWSEGRQTALNRQWCRRYSLQVSFDAGRDSSHEPDGRNPHNRRSHATHRY